MTTRSTDITTLSVGALSRALDAGAITSCDVAAAFLDRIENRADIKAWVHVDRAHVMRAAKAVDAAPRRSPLAGIPVGVKDLMDTFDAPTAYGSSIYAGHQPRVDAAFVAMLRRAGCIVIGKTVTTEFAFRHPNVTVNPHNTAHTPGGSSSGSAAAVADFQVPFATGTQTAGSIVRPAGFCGIVGYKPTYGDFPLAGIKPCAPSLDTAGYFARSVSDIALIRNVLFGESAVPALTAVPVVGVCRTPSWADAEPAAQTFVEAAARAMKARGARVEEVELPPICDSLLESQRVIMRYETLANLHDEVSRSAHLLSQTMRTALDDARAITHVQYRRALAHVELCRPAVDQMFTRFSALLTPSTVGEAPRGLSSTGEPTFNSRWTMLHTPCITLPVGRGPVGLPIGVQLVGPRTRDAEFLGVAQWTEEAFAAAGLQL